jgi:hypothetical protein
VTQLAADGQVFARLMPGTLLTGGYRVMEASAFERVTRVAEGVLMVDRPKSSRARIRLDADVLAWRRGTDLFIERSVNVTPLSTAAPGERAQVYSHPDADPDLPAGVSYIELELAEAARTLKAGQSAALDATWELVRLPVDEQTPEAIAKRVAFMAQAPH